jgi:hypothetical protein
MRLAVSGGTERNAALQSLFWWQLTLLKWALSSSTATNHWLNMYAFQQYVIFNAYITGGAVPDLICKQCDATVDVPSDHQLAATAPPPSEEPADELTFEQQQEALFRILTSYQEAD